MNNKFYDASDCERIGAEKETPKKDYRSSFQVDRDRIIHTSSFRRLQNKTQVFFSGEYDFYRTRLTHSIEVAQIGRSICNRLNQTSEFFQPDFFVDADLVEAACLAHDIGHPPFGHTGERTLHRLMRNYGGFEGNAQTLRILTKLLFGPNRGMNPSRALIDGVLKYKTLYGEIPNQKNHFLYAEQKPILDFVIAGQSFPAALSPGDPRNEFKSLECQIMDWADDTAYSLNDIADGVHAGFITVDKLDRWMETQSNLTETEAGLVRKLIEAIRKDRIESTVGKKIGAFIAAANLCETSGFLSDDSNRHRFAIAIEQEVSNERDLYKRISLDLVFRTRQLQQLDRKSDYILTRLFEAFADQYITKKQVNGSFRLLPDEEEVHLEKAASEEERARIICDVLARMTDGIATRTYKRLFDADFGSIVDIV